MADLSRSLEHGTEKKDDDAALQKEAEAHLAKQPAVQLVAELGLRLRQQALPWWSPEALRETWSAQTRMRWLAQRPDVRQGITTRLTGLAPKAARKKAPDFQSALIDSVIDDGDISVPVFEEVFSPVDMAVYGPAAEIWRRFHERMPWNEDRPPHQELVAWLIKALLADESSLGPPRRPILTPWDVRTAIDGKVWHARIPIDIRIAIDEARLQQERAKPGEAFHASHELAIAVPEIITESIPLKDLLQVIAVAERALGFDPSAKPRPEADAKPRPAASVPPVAAAGPRLGDASPKAETPGATSGGQMATASGDGPPKPAIPPRSTPAPPPVAGAVAAFAPPYMPPRGAHPLPHPPSGAAPLRASAPPPASPSTPPGPRAAGSMPPPSAGQPPAASAPPPARVSAPAPAAAATAAAAEPEAEAEPEDLESTNPWAVPQLGELGLDDEELRKLGGAHAVPEPPQAGRASIAEPPQAGRASIADPPTADPVTGGGKRRKSGKSP